MTLPVAVRAGLEATFGALGAVRAVSGGSVNRAARVETGTGPVFVKYSPSAPAGMYGVEAAGLRALRAAAGAIRVPEVLAVRDGGGGSGWLALEWLEPAPPVPRSAERFGRGLAALHRTRAGEWGWEVEGFIGPLPQPNEPTRRWGEFWAERRLGPMLRRAREAGHRPGSDGEWDRLLAVLPALLSDVESEGPSLLHGDLWSGNAMVVGGGEPALVDPAAYHGHREVDLAMSELFGGFDAAFYAAYEESWALRPGYRELRRDVYQLFYLLVHVILFGESYTGRTRAALHRALAATN